jgi:hypothetical protein
VGSLQWAVNSFVLCLLFHRKEFDPYYICHGFEIVVSGHQHVIGGVHRQIKGEGIGVRYIAVETQLDRMHSTFAAGRNDL